MGHPRKILPPFAWLGRFWVPVGLCALTIIAAFLRFYQLNSLPPGLDETSARIGLEALKITPSHLFPALDSTNGYAPLWVWLQAVSVHIFGHTALALRLWAALLGTAAVIATWFWTDAWFGRRTAWIGAFFIAVSPWAITLSRNGVESVLLMLLVPLTLLASSHAHAKRSARSYVALGGVLAADLLSGPIGWLLATSILAIGGWKLIRKHDLLTFNRARLAGMATFVVGAGLFAYFIGVSFTTIKNLPHALNLSSNLGTLGHNLVKVLLMFNLHGDENYRHNLSGEPLLNAFVGIMMVAGLLVCISRLHKQRYQIFLILLIVLLLPAALATNGAPNSSWAVGALPLIFALSAVGTSYMLELWYTTFPINSAARATGQAAIFILLALSLLEGFTQYFKAWGESSAVYTAYSESATQIGLRLADDTYKGERFVVIPADQTPVVDYLRYGQTNYHNLTIAGLQAVPVAASNRKFYIAASTRDDAVKVLKAKFPGGTLQPHYSSFNLAEIYYTYEVNK